MMRAFQKMGYSPKKIRLHTDARIPIAWQEAPPPAFWRHRRSQRWRKLMSDQEIYELAVEIEGHSDNITSQYFGGLTTSVSVGGHLYYQKIPVPAGITLCPMIPEFNLETKEARAVLPPVVDHGDAVHNVGRTALLIAAIAAGDWDMLLVAFDDRLHEPFRSALIPDFDAVRQAALDNGALGVYLSGGGPTIMSIKRSDDADYIPRMTQALENLPNDWKISEVGIDTVGTRVEVL